MPEQRFVLFDDECRDHLLPFTFTRPVAELRVGILTIREKWQRSLNARLSYFTQPYLRKKFALETGGINCYINGSVLPDPRLVAQVKGLQEGEAIVENDLVIAFCADGELEDDSQVN